MPMGMDKTIQCNIGAVSQGYSIVKTRPRSRGRQVDQCDGIKKGFQGFHGASALCLEFFQAKCLEPHTSVGSNDRISVGL